MEPNRATAWQCGHCRKLYQDDHRGRELAESCCRCGTCGQRPSAYTGQGTQCELCHARKVVATAQDAVASGQAMLEQAQAQVARLEAQEREAQKASRASPRRR